MGHVVCNIKEWDTPTSPDKSYDGDKYGKVTSLPEL